MMLPSCLVKCMQSLGQLVLQRQASGTALWPEMYPADAHDAPLLPRQMHAITRAVGFGRPCGRKCTQLMLMMLPSCLVKCMQSLGQLVLQRLASRTALWPEMYPADAHDAPPASPNACNHSGSWFCNAWRLGRPCGRMCTQLMLMMPPSCLVKQLVLQRLASRTALWPEMYPADAHDAPLLPRQMHAITRAVGFATPGV